MNWNGVILGAAAFLIIGVFHPIVIKCEYYFTSAVWPVFLVGGLLCCGVSVLADSVLLSALLGVLGFSMLWSIGELKEQERRVERGWFPRNPRRPAKKQDKAE